MTYPDEVLRRGALDHERPAAPVDTLRLTRTHATHLGLIVGLTIAVVMPASIAAWITASDLYGWDVVFTARAANVCAMALLAAMLLAPLVLFRRQPTAARLRGFVIVWFVVSPFFNATWQLPLIVFRHAITSATVSRANLPRFIAWWGYGSIDSHYGRVSSFMIASESWWLLAMTIGVVGLIVLLRGRSAAGYLILGVSGALQAYNASFYVVENGIVDHFRNVATGSFMGPLLYFGFAAIWVAAATTASVICLRRVLPRMAKT